MNMTEIVQSVIAILLAGVIGFVIKLLLPKDLKTS